MRQQEPAAPRWAKWVLIGGIPGSIVGMASKWTSLNAFEDGHDTLGGLMLLGGEVVCFGSIAAAMVGGARMVFWKARQEQERRLEKER